MMASSLLHGRLCIIITVIILVFLPLTSAFAQVQEAGEEEITFLPYDNPTYGIFIQYPSGWTASTSGLLDYTDVIAFYSPLQNVSDLFPARLKISVVGYSQNVSLADYTNMVWTILNQSQQVDVRSSSSEVTVAGHPGYRIVFADIPLPNSTLTLYHMNTWTTIGNKVYLLTYEGEESTFNQHLPEVDRMMESLSISTTDNAASPTTPDREGGGVVPRNQTQQQGFANQTDGGGVPRNQTQQQGFANQTDGAGPLDVFTDPLGDLFGGGQQ